MKAVIYNLGCKVNKYECDCLARILEERGWEVSEKLERADVYVINTCAVTAEAERKSRQCVARRRKFNEHAKGANMGGAPQNGFSDFVGMGGGCVITGHAG